MQDFQAGPQMRTPLVQKLLPLIVGEVQGFLRPRVPLLIIIFGRP